MHSNLCSNRYWEFSQSCCPVGNDGDSGLFETCYLLCQISLLRSALSALPPIPLFLTSLHTLSLVVSQCQLTGWRYGPRPDRSLFWRLLRFRMRVIKHEREHNAWCVTLTKVFRGQLAWLFETRMQRIPYIPLNSMHIVYWKEGMCSLEVLQD